MSVDQKNRLKTLLEHDLRVDHQITLVGAFCPHWPPVDCQIFRISSRLALRTFRSVGTLMLALCARHEDQS